MCSSGSVLLDSSGRRLCNEASAWQRAADVIRSLNDTFFVCLNSKSAAAASCVLGHTRSEVRTNSLRGATSFTWFGLLANNSSSWSRPRQRRRASRRREHAGAGRRPRRAV